MSGEASSRIDSYGREVSFLDAAGTSLDDFSALIRRQPAEDSTPDDIDTWVYSVGRDRAWNRVERVEQGRNDRTEALWRSPSGDVFVPATSQHVHVHVRRAASGGWEQLTVPDPTAVLIGAGGTADGTAFFWGLRAQVDGPAKRVFYRAGDGRLEALPSPGMVTRVCGVDQASVLAAGQVGQVSRWDGGAWRALSLDTVHPTHGLDVTDDDVFVTTQYGELFRVSKTGASRVPKTSHRFLGIARFGGHLYLASSEERGSLLRWPFGGDTLETVRTGLHIRAMCGGPDKLFLCSPDALLDFDGTRFRERSLEAVQDALEDTPPLAPGMAPAVAPPPKAASAGDF